MMTRSRFLTLGLAALLWSGQASADVPGISKEELKALDAVVGTTMDGYNAKNHKQFYSTWAGQMKSIQTPQAFQSFYVDRCHKDYGTLKSRTIDESRSTFSEVNGLIMYNAVFSKKKGTLAVNFFKEGGKYKVQQVQVNP